MLARLDRDGFGLGDADLGRRFRAGLEGKRALNRAFVASGCLTFQEFLAVQAGVRTDIKGGLAPLTPTRGVTPLDPPDFKSRVPRAAALGGSRATPWSGERGEAPMRQGRGAVMSSPWCWGPLLAVPLLLLAGSGPARATGPEAEAKATALASNCKPGKVEVMRQIPGGNGEIVYKITCTDYQQMFVLVQCRQNLCILLR